VRETFCYQWDDDRGYSDKCWYRASTPDVDHVDGDGKSPWKPSIHMPRDASRITLEITGVRVERLQDISEADAEAEGLKRWMSNVAHYSVDNDHLAPKHGRFAYTARHGYEILWNQINGPESWEANPWVWCLTFKRITEGASNG
jgi:hypothetical protein